MDGGYFDQVLQLTDDIIARITRAGGVNSLYDDGGDALHWIYDCRARALLARGSWREAETELVRAADRLEHGRPNVSNVINLAMFYADRGQGKEALAVLDRLRATQAPVAPYGKALIEFTKLTAAVSLHDKQTVSRSLQYLREHQSENLRTLQFALVRAGATDEAAQLIIRRLHDPLLRSSALEDVQIYYYPPEPPLVTGFRQRWDAILSRADVKAVIDSVGWRERVPLPPNTV